MSRSRKKHPYIKDHNPGMHVHRNRAARRTYRQISTLWKKAWYQMFWVYEWPEEDHRCLDDPDYPDLRSIVNDYDICDWYYLDKERGYRK